MTDIEVRKHFLTFSCNPVVIRLICFLYRIKIIARSYIIWAWESYKLILVTLNAKQFKFQRWLIRKHSRPGIIQNKFRESENHKNSTENPALPKKIPRIWYLDPPSSPPQRDSCWKRGLSELIWLWSQRLIDGW